MKSLVKSVTVTTFLLLISKVLGFIRELCLAHKFGTSRIVDVYDTCISLPTVLFMIFCTGFSNSYVPFYMRIRKGAARHTFFNNSLTILTVISLILTIMCEYLSKWIAMALAPGFDPIALSLLVQFVKIMVLILPFMVIFNITCAQMYTYEDFIFPAFCDYVIINIIIIFSILIASEAMPNILPIGYFLSTAIAAVLLWFVATRKKEICYKPRFCLHDPVFLRFCLLAIPLGISRLVNQLNSVADRIFASLLGEGVISAMGYANRVQLLFFSLTTDIFLSVCYPRVNQRFAEGDREGGLYYIRRAFLLAVYISVPVAGGLFLFANPVVAFLFQRGNFTTDSTAMTAGCLTFYALGLPFYALREIGLRALSASLEQKKILKNTMIAVGVNILLDFLLLRPMGYRGLALATSLAGMLSATLMLLDAQKMGLRVLERSQLSDLFKIFGCAALALTLSIFCYHFILSINVSFALMSAAVLGMAFYGLATSILRVGILIWLYARLPKKLQIIPWLNRVKP